MAVSSLKGCWSKLSARIRDYIDVVDSYYRTPEELVGQANSVDVTLGGDQHPHQHVHHHHHHRHMRYCEHKSPSPKTASTKDKRASNKLAHDHQGQPYVNQHRNHQNQQHQHHHHHHQHESNCFSHDRDIRRLTMGDGNCGGITYDGGIIGTMHNSTTVPSTRLTSLGYTKRKSTHGQVYFVDLNGRKSWYDPSVPKELLNAQLDLDLLVGPLPSEKWEVRQTSGGRKYFINHNKKTTQFTDPRLIFYKDVLMSHLRPLVPSSCQLSIPSNGVANKKELYDKISILRQELLKQQVLSHLCRIDISRKRIFEESFRAVSQMQARDLKKRLLVKFRGEEGLDYGGVAREWFYLLSREILNPVHGLFQYTGDDNYNLQINPDSGIVYREHLSYMNFCGRIIGMAIFHGHYIEGRFSLPLYKMLLKKPITLSDIEVVDPELYRSLRWILDNDITDVIDTTFLVHHNAFGQLQEHELKLNGRNITVTEENKREYVSLYVNYRCRRGIENQFSAIQHGFHELIQPSLVENFDERELELLIGGLSKIDIEDWRLHTKLKNCTVETPLVIWFWDIVKSYDEDKRARLLQFVTGSPRVPIQGFKALQGVNSELRLFTIHMIRNGTTDNLPKSHTCFNRIDLPPYETYDKLRDKLTQAIEETIGFAMQ